MRCATCKQNLEFCARHPAVLQFQSKSEFVYKLKWTRFNGYFLSSSGKLYSWGKATSARGRVKDVPGLGENEPIPIPVFLRIIIVDLSCGSNHVLALESQLFVWTWGYNSKGQLGTSDSTPDQSSPEAPEDEDLSQRRPMRLNKLNEICKIHANRDMSFAVNSKGKLFTWGDNSSHQLNQSTDIVRQPTLVAELPWYEANKPAMRQRIEDEKNEALDMVMFRLDISEMKMLIEDNRDLKRRLTDNVRRLNDKESDIFLVKKPKTETEDLDIESLADDSSIEQAEDTKAIYEDIRALTEVSREEKIKTEDAIADAESELRALEETIALTLKESNEISEKVRSLESGLEQVKKDIGEHENALTLAVAKEDVTTVDPEDELLGITREKVATEADLLRKQVEEDWISFNQIKRMIEDRLNEKAKQYEDLGKYQEQHVSQSEDIRKLKQEEERLGKLIQVYESTYKLTQDKLADDYFESHKKVITYNLNFLHQTQMILNETLIVELSKVVPISSVLELIEVSKHVMNTMDDEIRDGVRRFSNAEMRKLNMFWRIVGSNYMLVSFVQDALSSLIDSTHIESCAEARYTPSPYWQSKRVVHATAVPTKEKKKTEDKPLTRDCCF